jgi:2-polyprenyl-3-methyl-5-hydroxy-6-metoxy-1,4-benzoquinol methylase
LAVNSFHSWVHRVDRGWDPISPQYAHQYAEAAWQEDRVSAVDRLEAFAHGLKGKRVLDLGGGPGQFSVLMAQRGALVTWHDVSREYLRIARARAEALGVSIEFSLGYLESAIRRGTGCFDIVFCRLCWSYSKNDRHFARLLFSLLGPGGVGYIECNTPAFSRPRGLRRLQHWLNAHLWWKIGHPLPPHGRIAALVQKFPLIYLELDYSSELEDVVIFAKGK